MVFKIDRNRSGFGVGRNTLRVNLSSGGGAIDAKALSGRSDSSSVSSVAGERSQLLEVNNVVSALSIANQAIDAVSDLRARQLALASEAESSPQSERQQSINSEIQSLQGEIDDISSSATFGDLNTLAANTFEVRVDSLNISQSISTSDATSFVGSLGLDTSTTEGASSARQALEDNITALSEIKTGFESALDKSVEVLGKVSDNLATKGASSGEESDRSLEFETLAKKIAGDIGNRFAEEKANLKVIQGVGDGLTPQRVADLLRQ